MKMTDLAVIMVLVYKDEMIEKGIIPKDVKWDKLTEEEQKGVKKFIKSKIEGKKKECSK